VSDRLPDRLDALLEGPSIGCYTFWSPLPQTARSTASAAFRPHRTREANPLSQLPSC